MNRIFLTGDTHGDFSRFSSKKFIEGRILDKKDYVVILGDFGGVFDVNESSKRELNKLEWLSNKKWTTLFLDGNHENFDRLNAFPEIEMFGNSVGKITDSIYHLKRGYVYDIANKSFFVFGGGYSIDKPRRREFTSWWKEEMPSVKEYNRGIKSLEKVNYEVDYVLTHTCSSYEYDIITKDLRLIDIIKDEAPLRGYLNNVLNKLTYRNHYFGHFHDNRAYVRFEMFFTEIKEIF